MINYYIYVLKEKLKILDIVTANIIFKIGILACKIAIIFIVGIPAFLIILVMWIFKNHRFN